MAVVVLERSRVFLLSLLFGVALMLSTVQSLALQHVTLAWLSSPDSRVAAYHVYYGTAPSTYTNVVDVGNATQATIGGLIESKRYYFMVTAVDALGVESIPSNEVSFTVPGYATLLGSVVLSNGAPYQFHLTASGGVPASWTLESSPDLKTWIYVTSGSNTPVNVSVPLGAKPKRFFRLRGQ
jgi:hypothetical protein